MHTCADCFKLRTTHGTPLVFIFVFARLSVFSAVIQLVMLSFCHTTGSDWVNSVPRKFAKSSQFDGKRVNIKWVGL